MITDVREWVGGYKAIYTDRDGNRANVDGTFALGPALSWYIWGLGYFVVSGADQGRIIPEKYRLLRRNENDI